MQYNFLSYELYKEENVRHASFEVCMLRIPQYFSPVALLHGH